MAKVSERSSGPLKAGDPCSQEGCLGRLRCYAVHTNPETGTRTRYFCCDLHPEHKPKNNTVVKQRVRPSTPGPLRAKDEPPAAGERRAKLPSV